MLLGAGGAAAAVSLSGTRDKGAGKEIFNSLVGSSDPISLVPQVACANAEPSPKK